MNLQKEVEIITKYVCSQYRVTINDVRQPIVFAEPRNVSIYIIDRIFGHKVSAKDIGEYFNLRTVNVYYSARSYICKKAVDNNFEFKVAKLLYECSKELDNFLKVDNKKMLCQKLAEIDYCLFLIEREETEAAILSYERNTCSQLETMLSKRLIDFAESRIYREYDLNREFQQIKINKAS
jgi:hypothetical protein